MYGSRDAAYNWEAAYGEFMGGLGLRRGMASPCIFFHKDRNIRAVVHGDDFIILGWKKDLDCFRQGSQDRFECKLRGRMGGW